MPIRWTIDQAARLATLHYGEAAPTFEEFAEAVTGLLRDPQFKPGYGILADRRGVPPPSREYVHKVVDFLRANASILGPSRMAALVSGTASYGMARMAQGLGADIQVRYEVFTELDGALEWLRETP